MLGHFDRPAKGLAVQDDKVYIGSQQRLVIVDISNPSQPTWIGSSRTLPDEVLDIVVDGNYAYVANKTGGLRIIDISNPRNPYEIGSIPTDLWQETYSVALKGDYAYMGNATFASGLKILNITDPSSPFVVGNYGVYDTHEITISGDYAYLPSQFGAHGFDGLEIVNIANPANPTSASIFSPDGLGNPESIDVQNNYAYLAERQSGQGDLLWGGGLRVINVTEPWNPEQVSYFNSTFKYANDVDVEGNLAYIADHFEGLRVIDISNPSFPNEVGYFLTYGSTWDVKINNGTVYVADGDRGLFILRYTGIEPQPEPTPTPSPTPTPLPDLAVDHIEVIQIFMDDKDPFNGEMIPLIAEKLSLVRVFLEVNGSTVVEDVTAYLFIRDAQGNLHTLDRPYNVNLSITAKDNPDRYNINDTINFLPNVSWLAGDVTFWAEIDPEKTIHESNESNNMGGNITIDFKPAQELWISFIPIDYHPYGCDLGIPTHRVNTGFHWAKQVYPTHKIVPIWLPTMPFSTPIKKYPCQPALPVINERQNWNTLFNALFNWNGLAENHADLVYGWLPESSYDGGAAACENRNCFTVAFGDDHPTKGPRVFAHEFAHLLGRPHTKAGPPGSLGNPTPEDWSDWPYLDAKIQIHGLDLREDVKTPDKTYDYMSYFGDLGNGNVWTSPWTFNHLYSETLGNKEEAMIQDTLNNPESFSIISGLIYTDDTAILDPIWVITSTTPGAIPPSGTEYCLEALNASDSRLASSCFDLSFRNHENGQASDVDGFGVFLPYSSDVARILLRKGEQEIVHREVTSHYPDVSIISPNGGENWTGIDYYTVTWVADDEDGDPLTYSVLYSSDSNNWVTVGYNITSTQIIVNSAEIAGGEKALIRVLATDGINTSFDESDNPFTVWEKAPEVTILRTQVGKTIPLGSLHILEGFAYDLEDGMLDETNLTWSSDKDGDLGTGSLVFVNLSSGQHTITLTATDCDGNVATDSIKLFVGYENYIPLIIH
jgi:hypothetical protein